MDPDRFPYCSEHTCQAPECAAARPFPSFTPYCAHHMCEVAHCPNAVTGDVGSTGRCAMHGPSCGVCGRAAGDGHDDLFCAEHACLVRGCTSPRAGGPYASSYYCVGHACAAQGCVEPRRLLHAVAGMGGGLSYAYCATHGCNASSGSCRNAATQGYFLCHVHKCVVAQCGNEGRVPCRREGAMTCEMHAQRGRGAGACLGQAWGGGAIPFAPSPTVMGGMHALDGYFTL